MAGTDYDLDLLEVESKERAELAARINMFYNTDSALKLDLAYHWEKNHLMLDGKQWLVYSGNESRGKQWTQIKVSKPNEYIPRPVTNYIFDAYQTLKAYLLQHHPRSTVRPNTQNHKDKTASKLAELVLECNWERLQENNNYEYAAACGITYGTVFKKDYWDTSTLTMTKLPKMEEVPVRDPLTGGFTYVNREVVDPDTGQPVMEEVSIGDVNTSIIDPFCMALDPLAENLHNLRWIMEYEIASLDIVKQQYGKTGGGFTGEARNLQAEQKLNDAMRRMYELKTSSGTKLGLSSFTNEGSSSMIDNAIVVKHYYERPSKKYKKGRYIVVAGDKVLYAGDPDLEGPEQGHWHPYSDFRWEVVPGRFWGKSPFDNATELQKRINSIDAAIILTRKTMAIPQKLNPKGSGVLRHEWTGLPGQQIDYRVVEGRAPETVPASGVDPQVMQERAEVLQAFKDITGAVDVLKGDRPPGVTAASAIEMLYETSTGKLRPVLDRWKKFIECSQKKQLYLVAKKYQEPREDFIKLLKSRNKDFPDSAISSFLGRDLFDNCNVIIEAGSNVPKLESARKSHLLQNAQIGVLGLEQPENRMRYLEDMGLSEYAGDVSPDIKRAEWENSIMDDIERSPKVRPVVFVNDVHAVHQEVHGRRMKEPAFMELPEAVQQIYVEHIQEHDEFAQKAKMQEMMELMMGGAPPMPEGGPMPVKGAGKGLPAKTQASLAGVDMPPDAKISK